MPYLQYAEAKVIAAPKTAPSSYLWAAAAAVVPTVIMQALSGAVSDTTFPAYYPFILAAGAFLGWRQAMLTTVLSALAASFVLMGPHSGLPTTAELGGTLLFLMSASAVIVAGETLRTAALQGMLRHTWAYRILSSKRVWPKGYGLLFGAALSLALWGGLIGGAMAIFGR